MIKLKSVQTNKALLKMLREKQAKLGIDYIKTDGGFYMTFKILFYILLSACTIINILFILGEATSLAANLAYLKEPSTLQSTQIATIKNSIYTVCIFGTLLILSVIFLNKKRPVLKLAFTIFPCVILIVNYYGSMSKEIEAGNYTSFMLKHLLPLGFLMVCAVITSVIELRQTYLDKKGMDEIAVKIYAEYSALADNITEEQWLNILNDYEPSKKGKKHKNKKERIKTEV